MLPLPLFWIYSRYVLMSLWLYMCVHNIYDGIKHDKKHEAELWPFFTSFSRITSRGLFLRVDNVKSVKRDMLCNWILPKIICYINSWTCFCIWYDLFPSSLLTARIIYDSFHKNEILSWIFLKSANMFVECQCYDLICIFKIWKQLPLDPVVLVLVLF